MIKLIEQIICVNIIKDGKTYVLSDSKGSTTRINTPENLLDFLLLDYGQNTVKVVWNLFELFAILQQQLPTNLIDKLIKDDRVWYENYKIFSSAGKLLSITYRKHIRDNFYDSPVEINVYGIRQYFPNNKVVTLDDLTTKANELMQTLKSLSWETNTLSSAIAIYNQAVLKNEFIPSIYDMGDEPEVNDMLSYAYKMMCREWRTIYKVGHFQNATDIDIRSGYPSFIRNFGNIAECKIKHSKSLIQSNFGICKGTLYINKDYSPIVNSAGKNAMGSYPDYITTEQWGYLTYYSIGRFDMEDGYFLNFNEPEDKPFLELMDDLYAMRENGGLRKTLAKNISVGFYGYQSQEYPERYGDYFSPIYSVMTTSRCALHMGKLIENDKLQDSLISVTVDGALIQRDIDLDTTNVIGGWKKDKVDALVLSVGHQYITDHKDIGTKDANQNSYDTMLEDMQNHPNKSMYGEVLLNKNMMVTNRSFSQYPKSGKELLDNIYESNPLEASL